WAASPCGRLSRPRTTTGPPPHPQAVGGRRAFPPGPARTAGTSRGPRGWFPRSPRTVRRVRWPALPLRHRHGYAAVSSPWPPDRRGQTGQGVPAHSAWRVRTAIQPRSTGFELAKVLRGFTALVPRVHLPVSLAGP